MSYFTYVLKSMKNGKFYIGYTSDLNQRIKLHNLGKNIATKKDKPWNLFYVEELADETDAIRREHQIKSWKSRKMMERLKF